MFTPFKDILTRLNYLLIFIIVAVVVFVILVLSSNMQLIFSIISYPDVSIFTKIGIIFELIGSIHTNFSNFSIFSIVTVSILFGINISAIWYLIKESSGILYNKSVISTGGGIVSAVLGGGCASCGTLVITPLLSFVGLGGILSFLPLGGQEFNILAVVFLSLSLLGIFKKIKTAKEVYKI